MNPIAPADELQSQMMMPQGAMQSDPNAMLMDDPSVLAGMMPMPNPIPGDTEDQHGLDDEHFENILDLLTADDLEHIRTKIWPLVKKANIANQNVKHIFSDILPLMAATVPNKSDQDGKANGGDDFVRNSGSLFLYSSAFLETLLNIANTIITIILVGDRKFDVKFSDAIKAQPGVDQVAERVKSWCDAYFGKGLLPGYREDLRTSIIWTILNGDGVRKIFHDPNRGNPRAGHIMPGDYFFTSNSYQSFAELKGFVHKFRISRDEMEKKIDSGEWSVELNRTIDEDDDGTQDLEDSLAKQTGRDDQDYMGDTDFNRVYNGYEYYNEVDFEGDPLRDPDNWGALPYCITFGDEGVVTAVTRRWMPTDPLRFALNDYVHYSFLPSLDKYSYGLAHVAGQRARAATVLQRQLMDSAQLANVQTGFFRPYGKTTSRNFDLKSGQLQALGGGDDDIRKSLYLMPYNPPNPAVVQLMESLENDIRKFSNIVNADLLNLATQAPAASLLGILKRLEQLPNSIIQGLYDTFVEELRIFKRKFYEWLPANEMFAIEWQGETIQICREDFSPGIEIVPCGNFSYESDNYKLMRTQLVLQQASMMPQFHNVPKILEKLYRDVGIPPDEVKSYVIDPANQPPPAPPPPPPSLEPVSENMNMMLGQPVQAYVGQDHEAHITVHQLLVTTAPQDPSVQAANEAHIKHHLALKLMEQLQAITGVQIPPETNQLPMEQQNAIAQEMAKGAMQLKEMQVQQQGGAQQQPIDPGIVGLEEIKANKEKAEIDAHIQMEKLRLEKEKLDAKKEIDVLMLKNEIEKNERENIRLQNELQQAEVSMALKLKEMEIKERDAHIQHLDAEISNLRSILDMEKLTEHSHEEPDEDEEEHEVSSS